MIQKAMEVYEMIKKSISEFKAGPVFPPESANPVSEAFPQKEVSQSISQRRNYIGQALNRGRGKDFSL